MTCRHITSGADMTALACVAYLYGLLSHTGSKWGMTLFCVALLLACGGKLATSFGEEKLMPQAARLKIAPKLISVTRLA